MSACPSNLNKAARDHQRDSPSSGSVPSLADTKCYHQFQTHTGSCSTNVMSACQGPPRLWLQRTYLIIGADTRRWVSQAQHCEAFPNWDLWVGPTTATLSELGPGSSLEHMGEKGEGSHPAVAVMSCFPLTSPALGFQP